MKVQHDPHRKDLNQKSNRIGGRKDQRSSAKEVKATQAFGQLMSTSMDEINEALDILMKTVDDSATEFLKDPSEPNLIKYTTAVRSFIKKANREAFSVEKIFDRHNRLYTLVREVDEKIARITDDLMRGQWKSIELASRIQEIRGVLLDMYI